MQLNTPPYCKKHNRLKPQRDSNLELLRIIAMLAIIAHHYVVNSTVTTQFNPINPTPQQYFLEIYGMWGKTAINSFILISGYFMCRMRLTWQRYMKLILQIYFYGFLITAVFAISGYEPISIKSICERGFSLFTNINGGFTASFMCFYAFVPFYNKLISALNKKEFAWLIGGILFVMTICSTVFLAHTMNEPLWYAVLYFIAAYIRLYPNKYSESLSMSIHVFIISVILSVVSVVILTHVSYNIFPKRFSFSLIYHFVLDSNRIMSFIVGLSAFLVAKNAPKFHNKFINTLSAGTFAVLLIHASSDTMRRWLWVDFLDVPGHYHRMMPELAIHALITPFAIYMVCSSIDYIYRKYVQSIIFK